MSYYSGNVRKRYVSPLATKIKASKRVKRLETISLIIKVIILVACYIGASWVDGGIK